MIFQTEKQLKEYGEKLPAENKNTIETAFNALKEAHKLQDLTAIESATTTLNEAWMAASQHMYNSTQQPGQDGSEPSSGDGKSSENVTDAEFEEVK